MRVQRGRVARRRRLDPGADRHALTGVIADDRLIRGSAGQGHGRPLGMPNHGWRIGHQVLLGQFGETTLSRFSTSRVIVKGCIADFTVGYARIADHPSDHPLYIGVENGGVVAIEPGVGAGAPTYDAGGRPACEGLSRPHPHSTNATSSHNLPDYGIR